MLINKLACENSCSLINHYELRILGIAFARKDMEAEIVMHVQLATKGILIACLAHAI